MLLANQMNSLNPGDNKEMMEARKSFLNKGYYDNLREEIVRVINKYNKKDILDLGCGEGHYTSFIANNENLNVCGLDISKAMINEASKEIRRHSNLNYIIASSNNIPTAECSFDAIVNCFAPIEINEIKRVLRENGILIKIVPGEKHLYELKEILYDNPYLNEDMGAISGLDLIEKEKLDYTIKIQSFNDLFSLFMMTPYYYKTPKDAIEKLNSVTNLTITIEFIIEVYQQ